MIAEPSAQLRLLELQACDSSIAQLTHRRANLPQIAELIQLDARFEEIELTRVEIQTKLDDVIAEQRRVEGEVDGVRARAARDEKRLIDGGLPAKELESLQHEIESLSRRQSTLEDSVLEVMEQRETLETQFAANATEQATVDAQRADTMQARDAEFAAIDDDIVVRGTERGGIAAEIPPDLLALYEKIRATNAGVGAAILRARRCEGCRMELASSEVSALRTAAPDAIVRCDNCRRILVRTNDSGL